ncbi:sigma-54 interaction domain-containing protein [Alkalicoccus halolimnae]|uniref:Sigma-54-dependent Fis family transcriptional regulator n=1 Tax=Alkalicoccus halolimnae TaxID=1667239 RepID=A0A5C7FLT4_9BACI|nr:sigma-54-dependent Fis family transcriptional regulator [Alkalicoccus halolimnae]TXF86356.1 sigma-54-dependent transcriptional regulator [Alkalicoccus halolimnae]
MWDAVIRSTVKQASSFLEDKQVQTCFNILGVISSETNEEDSCLPVYKTKKEAEKGRNQLLTISAVPYSEKEDVCISFETAKFIAVNLKEKNKLIESLRSQNNKLHKIVNTTHDGMIAIDEQASITLMNKSAEDMTGLSAEEVLGSNIKEVMPTSRLPRVLRTSKTEHNQKQYIGENHTIITTRVPMYDGDRIVGALGVFRDITEIAKMAEEVTNLKSIQTMLEAIIQSSDDAISVVDEQGHGLIINPAYTRLTGLTEEQVIGKPASTDISEGESIHMKVLQTKKAVRGARMKVGDKKKDVVVNVAPVIVDDKIKGSVGVVHDVSEMEALTSELEQAKRIIRTLEAKYQFADIIGDSSEMHIAIEQARVAAKTPATILLRGESGTGKELFAHAIHNESHRKYNKFIRVNCAALTESLLESELFGYEEGAFSGAKRGGKKGLFEEADKGSIFLDEIGELSPKMQAKLLRVLQEGEIVRVGGTNSITIDVRVITATNIDMEKKIETSEFRSDLYFRLNRLPIYIPALRERKEDIPLLAKHLLTRLNQDYGRNVQSLSEEGIMKLFEYDWPGNVRELENVLGRAIIHMPPAAKIIHASRLTLVEKKALSRAYTSEGSTVDGLEKQMAAAEKTLIKEALMAEDGNKTKTAKRLQVSIRNLYYKMEKHGLR